MKITHKLIKVSVESHRILETISKASGKNGGSKISMRQIADATIASMKKDYDRGLVSLSPVAIRVENN